jgi:hypothetical protein
MNEKLTTVLITAAATAIVLGAAEYIRLRINKRGLRNVVNTAADGAADVGNAARNAADNVGDAVKNAGK